MKYWLIYFLCISLTVGGSLFAADRLFEKNEVPALSVLIDSEICEISAEEFAVRVLIALGDGCKEAENKKAVAVAARSCAAYIARFGCKHDGFDLCDDGNCCFALGDPFYTEADFLAECVDAVKETHGLCLTFDSTPAMALFSPCNGSGGVDCKEFPYIIAVAEKERCNLHITERAVDYSFLETELDCGKEEIISNSALIYDDNQKCRFAILGGKYFEGSHIKDLLNLESEEFTLALEADCVTAKSYGVGNGLGLSVCGGDRLARKGFCFEDILKNYYPNLELNKMYNR